MATYKEWISSIDVDTDYFAAFVKSWIAFNAWYNNSGEIQGKTDKECIEYIAGKTNRFKSYMINLLEVDDNEGAAYKVSVANLHSALKRAPIVTQEYVGVRSDISFASVPVKNDNNNVKETYYGVEYCLQRKKSQIVILIKKSDGTVLFSYEQDEYSKDDLCAQSTFKNLKEAQRSFCLQKYKELEPYKMVSILDSGDKAKLVGEYSLVNDSDRISNALIVLIYMLRCCLFHGDVAPDKQSNEVYRYAYEVLSAPLKKLL